MLKIVLHIRKPSNKLVTHTSDHLEPQFQQPEGWRWHGFKRNGRTIRFGSVFPKDSIPDAIVVCLGGLSEFAEKYYEVAHDCLKQNYAFWTMDWVGQGKSGRYLNDPQKRHGVSFEEDIEDLEFFIKDYVIHSSVHPDVGRIPMALLAHSMGGNIGLQYMNKYPERFECAAFCAPLCGIHAVSTLPFSGALSFVLNLFLGKFYVFGGKEWREDFRPAGDVRFFTDLTRAAIHNQWCLIDPELQVGNVTFGWVYHALRACKRIQKVNINAEMLFATAEHEAFVDNLKIRALVERLPNASLIHYDGSGHEILMERDEIRDDFLERFFKLIKETIIDRPETLKPF